MAEFEPVGRTVHSSATKLKVVEKTFTVSRSTHSSVLADYVVLALVRPAVTAVPGQHLLREAGEDFWAFLQHVRL